MDQLTASKHLSTMYDSSGESDFALLRRIKMEPEAMLSHDDDIIAQLHQDSSDLEVEPSFALEQVNGEDNNTEDVEVHSQHMDIRQPLSTLKLLLEQKLNFDLSDFQFWLQDTQVLENHKNLVDQCVQGEGLVQVNVQINLVQKKINIVDVLKPAEDYVQIENQSPEPVQEKKTIRWTPDIHYKQEQERLKIPSDPMEWSQTHVKHWLQWAVRQFNLASIRLADWNITGEQLCNLKLEEFQAKVPVDKGDTFWTHLELLKKFKLVTVLEKNQMTENIQDINKALKSRNLKPTKPRAVINQHSRLVSLPLAEPPSQIPLATSSRAVTSSQIQLWQFLLELLTDREHREHIEWVGSEGEFKLHKPDKVASLWGKRKNKPSMNYEKLSRALRYYYDGNMISKVQGKRFAYKFDCDLKNLLGYSAEELSNIINESPPKYY